MVNFPFTIIIFLGIILNGSQLYSFPWLRTELVVYTYSYSLWLKSSSLLLNTLALQQRFVSSRFFSTSSLVEYLLQRTAFAIPPWTVDDGVVRSTAKAHSCKLRSLEMWNFVLQNKSMVFQTRLAAALLLLLLLLLGSEAAASSAAVTENGRRYLGCRCLLHFIFSRPQPQCLMRSPYVYQSSVRHFHVELYRDGGRTTVVANLQSSWVDSQGFVATERAS